MCPAQGPQAVAPVRLEPEALRSRVKHSTTEPLRSLLLGSRAAQDTIFKALSDAKDVFSINSELTTDILQICVNVHPECFSVVFLVARIQLLNFQSSSIKCPVTVIYPSVARLVQWSVVRETPGWEEIVFISSALS